MQTPEQELIKLAADTAKEAKIAFLMLPGVGTKEDIIEAQGDGGRSADRHALHRGRRVDPSTSGWPACAASRPSASLVGINTPRKGRSVGKQARIMADAGCQPSPNDQTAEGGGGCLHLAGPVFFTSSKL